MEDEDKKINVLYRSQAYFLHGHGSYTGFIVSIMTFLLVFFDFLVKYVAWIGDFFIKQPMLYFVITFPAYTLIAILIGRWSYYKGPFAARAKIEWSQNPEYMEMKSDLKENKKNIKEMKGTINDLRMLLEEKFK